MAVAFATRHLIEVRCMCVIILNMYLVCHSMTGRSEPCEAGPLGPIKSISKHESAFNTHETRQAKMRIIERGGE